MLTVCIQIGNSDDKLPQKKWSEFMALIHHKIKRYAHELHFTGHSHPAEKWQNWCCVFTIDERKANDLAQELKHCRAVFDQESLAWLEGETVFL